MARTLAEVSLALATAAWAFLTTLACRLAAGVKAGALQGVAAWPSSAKARLAFLSRSFWPMWAGR